MMQALVKARRALQLGRSSPSLLFSSGSSNAGGAAASTMENYEPEAQSTNLVKKKQEPGNGNTAARLIIAIKTAIREFRLGELPKSGRLCGLPTERSLFTVIRGPHVHKKSREQYDIQTRKWHLTIDTQTSKLREKLDFLKENRVPGVEIKAKFQYKTRLAWPPKPTKLSDGEKWRILKLRDEDPELNTAAKLAGEFGIEEQQVYDVVRVMEERKKHIDRFGVPGSGD